MDSSVFELAEFPLCTTVAGAGGLAQQLLANASIPCVTAFAAHQLTEAALRRDHAFARRLFEQAASEMLGVMAGAQARAVEQPFRNTYGKSLGRGNSRKV